jgi:peptide/nickel transport system permease protein
MASETPESVFETTDAAEPETDREKYGRLLDLWVVSPLRIMWTDWRTRLGGLIIFLYLLMGTVGVMVIDRPQRNEAAPYLPPFHSLEFPLGTNATGTDLFGLIVHATPAMWKLIIAGAVLAGILGTVVGTVAGYRGGRTDTVLMTLSDIFLTIPGLPLVIVLSIVFTPKDPFVVGIILSINNWPGLARTLRSQVLSLRNQSYVEASSVMGFGTSGIVSYDILPNVMPYILISFMNTSRQVIYNSVALYFLGILPFTLLNWGVIINLAHEQGALASSTMWHWLLLPIITIVVLSLGTVLLAQSTDRIFNPRVRAKHDKETETTTAELGG